MTRRTKIVATVGPASTGLEMLQSLIEAGVDVIRLNLAHGAIDTHVDTVHRIRRAAEATDRWVGVLADLPGPKLRTGPFPEGGAPVEAGDLVELIVGGGASGGGHIEVAEPGVADLEPGEEILLGDGVVELIVEERTPDGVKARVTSRALLQGRPGVHLPETKIRGGTPTPDDLLLAERMLDAGVDLIGVSFVRAAAELEVMRKAVGPDGAPLVAKIETVAAAEHLEEIIPAADAVMVARGDLATACPLEDVPHLQKRIISLARAAARPVITATQMLESMISAPVPTRAEVSDVANAVLDGTDAVMLSGETAIGHDPVLVVRTMARIAERADEQGSPPDVVPIGHGSPEGEDRLAAAIASAAESAVDEAGGTAILCCTRTGSTAQVVARLRPESCTLVGLSSHVPTLRRMALVWGVRPVVLPDYSTTEEMIRQAALAARRAGLVAAGDLVAVVSGPVGAAAGGTDRLALLTVP